VGEAATEHLLWHSGNGLQEGQGYLVANHGSRLQEALLRGWQPVDTRRQHRLHRGRHLNGWQRLCQAIGPPLAHQHVGLDQGPDALLQEERIPFSPLDQHTPERREVGIVPEEALK
jgi:hypothetical protein